MTQKLQPVRGTRDVLPEEARKLRHIERVALECAHRFGFGEIQTPMFEATQVFSRTLGDTSDIVSKEMYTFQDRGGDDITLRPEGTAGVARAFISEGMAQNIPVKLLYCGPMFRYERPQKGRYRQFLQTGVELLGVEKPQADIEVIALGHMILQKLNLDKKVTLEINTLGDRDSQLNYRNQLVAYLQKHEDKLSADSKNRLQKNPLRILDSKDEGDKAIVKSAPAMREALTPAAREFYHDVLKGLKALNIPYRENATLVRGLDYYVHTVFEFTTEELGAQNTVLAGGRYDGLIQLMGGPPTPGVGWAFGTDRLGLLLEEQTKHDAPIAIVPFSEELEIEAIRLAQDLRDAGHSVDQGYGGNMGKRMKRADKIGAGYAVILAPDEMGRGVYTVKNLKAGTQEEVPHGKITEYFLENRRKD